MRILAIETSCDETAAAVVEDGTKILSNVVASSTAMHEKYGGIVPEIAAREQLKCITPVITEALQPFLKTKQQFNNLTMQQFIIGNIDAIAVTVGPGLIGSLLVGVETAKTLAFVTCKPIIPVNHVLAHMYANFIDQSASFSSVIPGLTRNPSSSKTGSRLRGRNDNKKIEFPAISLVVSGGHTELYLMKSVKDLHWLGGTLDDAAGEAFDKTARLLGFGSRGGLAIQEAAKKCRMINDKCQIKLPRPMLSDDSLNFSFSGLKTAVLREVNKLKTSQQFNTLTIQQLSYEVQEAITDVLVTKTLIAAKNHYAKSILISGGVAANLRLREKFNSQLTTYNLPTAPGADLQLFAPPPALCTDNAVYIAAYAFFRGLPIDWHSLNALPDLNVETQT